MTPSSFDYFLRHEELVVLPPEHLSPSGISAAMRDELNARGVFGREWLDTFDRCFGLAWSRLDELHRHSGLDWFPPRLQHVCVVRRGGGLAPVRPYFEPFHRMAWLVEESDFDLERSSIEFGVAQLLLVARMGVAQQVAPAYVQNLSYWMLRSDAELEDFRVGCSRSVRPDAEAAGVFGELAARSASMFHAQLRPPQKDAGERMLSVPDTGLVVAEGLYPELQQGAQRCAAVVQSVATDYYAQFGQPDADAVSGLARWLVEERPRVVVTGGRDGRVLWSPNSAESLEETRAALGPLSRKGAESVRDDLAVCGRVCRDFVESLADAEALPEPDEEHADQDGLSYMHLTEKEVAYNLDEKGMRRRLEPAPPYERLMLAARTAHEWAHLATEAGWVDVPEPRQAEVEVAVAALASAFQRVLEEASQDLRHFAAPSFERADPCRDAGLPVAARELAEFALSRVEDFQSNLLARRYLEDGEIETYVRNNLRSHSGEFRPEQGFHLLARYLYEQQYLRFSSVVDPWRYLVRTTWFRQELIDPGFVTEETARQVSTALGGVLDLYSVDERRFSADQGSAP
ncbi:MAG: hypothetical protein AAF690_23850 [Acidobacteriota bacterium]